MINAHHLRDPRIASTQQIPLCFLVKPRSLLFVNGANGSGKSTLLKLIAGLRIPSPDTHITIHSDYIYLGSQNGLLQTARVRDYIMPCNFVPTFYHHQLVGHLSQGIQRRVALAHMMQYNKKLWIMDEPTAYLDVKAQKQFYDYVLCHIQQGGAALIASHDHIPESLLGLDVQTLDLSA